MTAATAPASRAIIAMLGFNAVFLIVNGVFMVLAPERWYYLIPGVKETGGYNQHFIRDIGIIQFFLGAAFAIGWIRPALRIHLWAAATLWMIAHAFFHFWEVAVGICAPSALLRDFAGGDDAGAVRHGRHPVGVEPPAAGSAYAVTGADLPRQTPRRGIEERSRSGAEGPDRDTRQFCPRTVARCRSAIFEAEGSTCGAVSAVSARQPTGGQVLR